MLLVELTIPHDDNIEAARDRKDTRYQKLLDDCGDTGWEAAHFSLEVGFIGDRVRKWLKKIGLNNREICRYNREICRWVDR